MPIFYPSLSLVVKYLA